MVNTQVFYITETILIKLTLFANCYSLMRYHRGENNRLCVQLFVIFVCNKSERREEETHGGVQKVRTSFLKNKEKWTRTETNSE